VETVVCPQLFPVKTNMHHPFLFRGVTASFHLANEGLLRPKSQGPFTYAFHWGEPGHLWGSGALWGSTPTNAVIRHQLNQEGFPTSGISTTPHIERATVYARGKDGNGNGFVFKIIRSELERHGITEFVVAQFCQPSVPEDDEVILVVSGSSCLPSTVVAEVIPIAPQPMYSNGVSPARVKVVVASVMQPTVDYRDCPNTSL